MHRAALLALIAFGTSLPAAVRAQAAGDFSAQVTFTTDYVYRGLSQSFEDPAIQGGIHYQHENGFFAGLWASSVDFPNNRLRDRPRDLEADLFLGYGFDMGPSWTGSAQVTRYTYPGDDPAFDYDYTELGLSVQFEDLVSAAVHISDDLLGRDEIAVVYEVAGRLPLGDRFEALAGLGLFDLDRVLGDSYLFWSAGASYTVGRFAFDVLWIDTSDEAEALFGPNITGSRLVASLTAHIE